MTAVPGAAPGGVVAGAGAQQRHGVQDVAEPGQQRQLAPVGGAEAGQGAGQRRGGGDQQAGRQHQALGDSATLFTHIYVYLHYLFVPIRPA